MEKYSGDRLEGSHFHEVLFVSVFLLGFIGVLVFYIYKKITGNLSIGESRYQYSVLSSNNLLDPDDDSNDPLINNFGRNDDDDNNFLDITRYRYSDDDDVELLGVSYLQPGPSHSGDVFQGSGDFLCDIDSHTPATVAAHTQVSTDQGQANACKNNRISSAILNDSDEVAPSSPPYRAPPICFLQELLQ